MDDRTVDLLIKMIEANKASSDEQYATLDAKLDFVVGRVDKQGNWQSRITGGLALASFLFVALFEGSKWFGGH